VGVLTGCVSMRVDGEEKDFGAPVNLMGHRYYLIDWGPAYFIFGLEHGLPSPNVRRIQPRRMQFQQPVQAKRESHKGIGDVQTIVKVEGTLSVSGYGSTWGKRGQPY
jgi:hypothetical protein